MAFRTYHFAEFQFCVMEPGVLPAVVYAFHGRAAARISLMPAVTAIEGGNLSPDDLTKATEWVESNRDTLLADWLADFRAPAQAVQVGRVVEAMYDKGRRALGFAMPNGTRVLLPLAFDATLAAFDDQALAEVSVIAGGSVVFWPRAGQYRLVQELLNQVTRPFETVAKVAEHPTQTPVSIGLQPLEPAKVESFEAVRPTAMPALIAHTDAAQTESLSVTAETQEVETVVTATASPARPVSEPASSGTPLIKSLLGLILYREGYLDQAQLRQIAEEQLAGRKDGKEIGFGQIAVERKMITRDQLQFALHLQNNLAHAADDAKPLGVSLIENCVVTPSNLLTALAEQKQTGERLGEVLVRREMVSRAMLDAFLARQASVSGQAAAPPATPVAAPSAGAPVASQSDSAPRQESALKLTMAGIGLKSLLGVILEREDYMNQVQVREVIEEQERRREAGAKIGTFGEIALELALISHEQLKFAIQLQGRLAYAPGSPKPLGVFLLENGVVKPSQLSLALEEAARTGAQLGQVLVDHSVISEQMVDVFLKMQSAQVIA